MFTKRIISDFSGERVNVLAQASSIEIQTVEGDKIYSSDDEKLMATSYLDSQTRLLACVKDETYAEHFITNAWDTPQDQIDAGFKRYIEPVPLNGTYDEVFTINPLPISSARVSVTFDHKRISGAVQVFISLAKYPSLTFIPGVHQIFSYLTKLRLHIDFKGTNFKSLIDISNLAVNIEEI